MAEERPRGGIRVPDWIARLPIAAEIAQQWWRANLSDPQAATGWLKAISADSASDLFKNLGRPVAASHVHAVLFAGRGFCSAEQRPFFREPIPGNKRTYPWPSRRRFVKKIVYPIRGTVNGTVVVAVGEGLFIGVGYLVAGPPNAVMFTTFTTGFRDASFQCLGTFSAAALTLISNGNDATGRASSAGER
ncbi:hypothetical protein ACVWXL_005901 [Bradyrhizobium sp. GM22.5]